MLIQTRLLGTAKNQIIPLLKRAFSTNQPETTPAAEQKNNDDLPFKYHEDWQTITEKRLQEQTKTLEADLSEQQKRRVRILADAYLELNTHELYHFNNVMEKKTSLDSVLAARQKSEDEIKYEEAMAKLWPMGQRGVAEIFASLFRSGSGGGFGVGGGAAAGGAEETASSEETKAAPTQEKAAFDLQLTSFDAAQKIKIIKEVREILKLGLKEAKEMVEKTPVTLLKDVKKEEAESLKEKLEATGCVITLL